MDDMSALFILGSYTYHQCQYTVRLCAHMLMCVCNCVFDESKYVCVRTGTVPHHIQPESTTLYIPKS